MCTICLLGQKQLNPRAKSKEVLVIVVVLFAFHLIGFRVACIDASNETYFKLLELARKKLINEIYIIIFKTKVDLMTLKKSRCFDGHDNVPFMVSLSIYP